MMFLVGFTAATADFVELLDEESLSSALSNFLPIVFSSESTTEEPVGALIVFSSSIKTTGDAGGRVGMNAICAVDDPNSHFCTIQELGLSLQTKGVFSIKALH